MNFPNINAVAVADPVRERSQLDPFADTVSTSAGAVSWAAIFAGAAGAAALSLILLVLGTGLGLSSVSPWAYDGVSKTTFGVSTILWLTFTQLVASGMGGYLAGRLRTKWVEVHRDEIYFRDTAHGFLAWAVSSLFTAALLTSVTGSIVNSGMQAAATLAGGVAAVAGSDAAKPDGSSGVMGYYIDSLFRRDATIVTTAAPSVGNNAVPAPLAEVSRIMMASIRTGGLPPQDARYVGQLVAQRTGLSQQAAEQRVADTYARAQASLRETQAAAAQSVDTARKASAYAALWLFVALLSGAFVASLAATLGGRQRDA